VVGVKMGARKFKVDEMVGQKFGFLTLKGPADPVKGRAQATFLCGCGAVTVKGLSRVVSGHTKSCGCARGASWRALTLEEMRGKRFGRLVVVGRNPTGTSVGGTRWDCLCDCGNGKTVALSNLHNGTTQSCGCFALESSSRNGKKRKGVRAHNWKGVGDISASFWGQILNGAQTRNLACTISHQYVWDLFLQQNRKCALTGVSLRFPLIGERSGTASLDRVDSTKGYEAGNVQWLDKRVQQMKWNLKQEEFLALCRAITEHGAKGHIVGA